MTAHQRPDGSENSSGVSQRTGITPKRMPHTGENAALRPKVMARLPSLSSGDEDLVATAPAPAVKRSLRQRVSGIVLLAAALVFVAVAVQPYFRKSPEGGKPPAENAPEAPAWNATAAPGTAPAANDGPQDFLQPNIPLLPNTTSAPPPVSIPALPASIPDVPPGIMGPAASGPSAPATPAQEKTSAVPSLGNQSALVPAWPPSPAAPVVSASTVAAPIASAPTTIAQQYPTTPYTSSYPTDATPFLGAANQSMNAAPAVQASGGSAATMPTGLAPIDMSVPKTAQGPNHDHAGSSLR